LEFIKINQDLNLISLNLYCKRNVMKEVLLNNGSKAKHIGEDCFGRPLFRIRVGCEWATVVSTEFDFDKLDLHSITRDGEPCCRIKEEYQPINKKG
jgi:hypothetical protein